MTTQARGWKAVHSEEWLWRLREAKAHGLELGPHFGMVVRYYLAADNRDVDGCHKIIVDALFEALGVNDLRLKFIDLGKVRAGDKQGVGTMVRLYTSI